VKTNESQLAFICFQQFFQILTFQCVTGEKNKKILPDESISSICVSRVTLCGRSRIQNAGHEDEDSSLFAFLQNNVGKL
jgi:hypothetical protein